MSRRDNLWLKFAHVLPPESLWGRIGNPVRVKDGYAFIVATKVPSSPVMRGGIVHTIMRYDETRDALVPADSGIRRYRGNKEARDALIHYQAREADK